AAGSRADVGYLCAWYSGGTEHPGRTRRSETRRVDRGATGRLEVENERLRSVFLALGAIHLPKFLPVLLHGLSVRVCRHVSLVRRTWHGHSRIPGLRANRVCDVLDRWPRSLERKGGFCWREAIRHDPHIARQRQTAQGQFEFVAADD